MARRRSQDRRRTVRTITVNGGQQVTLVEDCDYAPSALGRPGEELYVGADRSDLIRSEAGTCRSELPPGRRPTAWPEGGVPLLRGGRWV